MTPIYRLLVLLALTALATPSWSQETPEKNDAAAKEATKETPPKFTATLLLVKADWSKSPHAKEIATELREALKDSAVPQELLDRLPASGPEILFGPMTVGLYSEEHHAELLAWLKAKDLIVSQDKFQAGPLPFKEEVEERARDTADQYHASMDSNKDDVLTKKEWLNWGGEEMRAADLNKDDILSKEELAAYLEKQEMTRAECTVQLSKSDDFLGLPKLSASSRPFVKSQADLTWRVFWNIGSADGVEFNRQLTLRDQVRGQEKPQPGKLVDNSSAALHIKSGRMLMMNAFPTSTEEGFRQAARDKGFEAVVMVGRELEKMPDRPARVHSPDWIDDRASFGHDPRFSVRPGDSVASAPSSLLGGSDEGAEAPAVKSNDDLKFTATLLLLKSDWSKSPHAKEIEAELREALKEASVPKELLDKLPASGPQILFAPELLAYYSEQHFAQLLAWLRVKELVASEAALCPPENPVTGKNPDWVQLEISEDDRFLNLPHYPEPDQPFVSRKRQLTWSVLVQPNLGFQTQVTGYARQIIEKTDTDKDGFISKEESKRSQWDPPFEDSDLDQDGRLSPPELYKRYAKRMRIPVDEPAAGSIPVAAVSVTRAVLVNSTIRGDESQRESQLQDHSSFIFDLKHDTVVVANAFVANGEEKFRNAARRQGFEAILFVSACKSLPSKIEPQLRLPERVRQAYAKYDKKLAWPQSVVKSDSSTPPEPAMTQILYLKRAAAADVTEILRHLMPPEVKLVADERTNAIIVNVPQEKLEELNAIVLRLDEMADVVPESRPPPTSTSVDLKEQYAEAERKAAALAKEVRESKGQAKDKLRDAVGKSFELRQKLLQAELAEFRERTGRIERSLRQREGIKKQIIERRVEDLLKPGLEWEGADAKPIAPAKPVATTEVAPPLSELEEARKQKDAIGEVLHKISQARKNGSASVEDVRSLMIERQKATWRLNVVEAELELKAAKAACERAEKLAKTGTITKAELDDARAALQKAEATLEGWRTQVKNASGSEDASSVKLREIELQQANLELQAAEEQYQRSEDLYKTGGTPQSVLSKRKLERDTARLKVDKAQTLLDAARQNHTAAATPPATSGNHAEASDTSSEELPHSPETSSKLAELDVEQAEVVLQSAEAELAEAKAANGKVAGTVPMGELRALEARVNLARLGVEKAKTLWESARRSVPKEGASDLPPLDQGTRIKLLELDVKLATVELDAAQMEYKQMEDLCRKRVVSEAELAQYLPAVRKAELKLQRAQTLLEAAQPTKPARP
jgi:multidrug resistance efflux pump